MTNQEESVNPSQSTHCLSQMTFVTHKKNKLVHWMVNLDTGPGLGIVSQLNPVLDMRG